MFSFLGLMLKSAVVLVIAVAVFAFITVKKEEREEKEWPIEQRKQDFFDACVQAGILNWDQVNSANQEAVLEIAKRCKLIPQNEYSLIGQTKKKLSEIFYIQSLSQENKESILEKRKELDQQEWQKRTAYADLTGVSKTLTSLSDWQQHLRDGLSKPSSSMQLQKKSDGMIQAGTAAGIGGVIPAAASMASTAKRNAKIEQYNNMASAFNSISGEAAVIAESTERKVTEAIKRFQHKKTTNLTRDAVFHMLRFSKTMVRPYHNDEPQTGTILVSTSISLQSPLEIKGTRYFIDGSVIAEIYDKDKKVGEATLVFPLLGTDAIEYYDLWSFYAGRESKPSSLSLEGLCLFCKAALNASWDEVYSYTVKFKPGKHLWAMESLTDFEVAQIKDS